MNRSTSLARLIDSGAVDIVHGHSSHHVRPLGSLQRQTHRLRRWEISSTITKVSRATKSYRDDLAYDVLFRHLTRGRAGGSSHDWFHCKSSALACGALQRLTPLGSLKSSLARAGNLEQELTTRTEASKWN